MKRKASGLVYVGPGFIPGVPARDLDPDEVERYGGAESLLNARSPHTGRPLYEVVAREEEPALEKDPVEEQDEGGE